MGIDLATAGDLAVGATTIDLHADKANVVTGALSYLRCRLSAEVERRIKVFAVRCDQTFERLTQRARAASTCASDTPLSARQIDYEAREVLACTARTPWSPHASS